MKIRLTLIAIMISLFGFSQKQYTIGTETVYVPGQIVSTIKRVGGNGKQIGSIVTHSAIDSTKAVFTSINTDGIKPYIIILQVITKKAATTLTPEIEVKKAWVNPEEQTNPKNYWDVSVAFRNKDQEVVEVGATEYYKDEGETTSVEKYLGTSYVVPFATKAAADTFATKLKKFLK